MLQNFICINLWLKIISSNKKVIKNRDEIISLMNQKDNDLFCSA